MKTFEIKNKAGEIYPIIRPVLKRRLIKEWLNDHYHLHVVIMIR